MAKAILRKNKAEAPDSLILGRAAGSQQSAQRLLAQNGRTDPGNRGPRDKLVSVLSRTCQQRRQESTVKQRPSQGFLPIIILTGVQGLPRFGFDLHFPH